MRSPLLVLSLFVTLILSPSHALASAYFEMGGGWSSFKNADSFFGQALGSSNGYTVDLAALAPITREHRLIHAELGVHLRLSGATAASGDALSMGSLNPALRLEIYRFYAGVGYSPISFVSSSGKGLFGLHTSPGNASYYGEAGAIWKVIPEFQIALACTLEYGRGSAGSSPSPLREYSIRFRFPFNPKETGGPGAGGVEFDGFRYPFGIMK